MSGIAFHKSMKTETRARYREKQREGEREREALQQNSPSNHLQILSQISLGFDETERLSILLNKTMLRLFPVF